MRWYRTACSCQGREACASRRCRHPRKHLNANDRQGLERLCRYGARGALALERLSRAEDGRLENSTMRVADLDLSTQEGLDKYHRPAFAQDTKSAEAMSYHNKPAQDAQLSFTPEQAQEMQRLAADYSQRNPSRLPGDTPSFMQQIADARNTDEVAAVFAEVHSEGHLAEHLARLRADPANRGTPLPGTLKLQNAP